MTARKPRMVTAYVWAYAGRSVMAVSTPTEAKESRAFHRAMGWNPGRTVTISVPAPRN